MDVIQWWDTLFSSFSYTALMTVLRMHDGEAEGRADLNEIDEIQVHIMDMMYIVIE